MNKKAKSYKSNADVGDLSMKACKLMTSDTQSCIEASREALVLADKLHD